jgi:hypothetical protein
MWDLGGRFECADGNEGAEQRHAHQRYGQDSMQAATGTSALLRAHAECIGWACVVLLITVQGCHYW